MTSQKNAQAVRRPANTREIQRPVLPQRRITRGDVIAEKLIGGTVSAFDIKRSLKLARDPSMAPEDRVKIIDGLAAPSKEVLSHEWASTVLGNIANDKNNDPAVREAARKTLFYRNRK